MKRNTFIKTVALTGIGLGVLPNLSFSMLQNRFTLSQLTGKGNPDIVGNTYTSKMHKEAKKAFLKMQMEARKDGIEIEVISAYRSFNRQKQIFEKKYKKYTSQGLTPLDTIYKIIEYSTIPGTSRHHWGTDIDIVSLLPSPLENPLQAKHFHGNGKFCKLKEWMDANSEKFGFYLVYTDNPKRKGFKYEPWHYSYAPVSIPMLQEYKQLDLKEILTKEKVLGSKFFTENFIEQYRNENILDINPKLL